MTVTATGAAGTNQAAPATSSVLGGADFNMFLKLLTTQMQNQDPLDPMDTSEYTQQLVQYSQVEQSIQQTGVLKEILARLSVQDMAEASRPIGRDVEVDSAVSGLGATTPARWSWTPARAVASVSAEILDASGRVVATPALAAGTGGAVGWDGLTASGARAPAGSYTLRLTARDAAGATVPVTIRSAGTVDTVTLDAGKLAVGINGITLPADKVVRVAARAA
jgi:flagellar basal-body rod modification protein FlgD